MKKASPDKVPEKLEEGSFSALCAYFFNKRPRSRITLAFSVPKSKDPGFSEAGAIVWVRITQTMRKNLESMEERSFFSVRIKVNPLGKGGIFCWRESGYNLGWEKRVEDAFYSPTEYPVRLAVWSDEPEFLEIRILEEEEGFWVAFGSTAY